MGRAAPSGTHILLLIQDLHIRIIDAASGELLRDLALDPSRNYQPAGAPKGPTRKPDNPDAASEAPEP